MSLKCFAAGIVSGLMILHRWTLSVAAALVVLAMAGCGSKPDEPVSPVRGEPIPTAPRSAPTTPPSNAPPDLAFLLAKPDAVENGLIKLGFDKLSAFKFDVHEVHSETNAGRPLLRSDDVIPPLIKAYDGKRVELTGFVLPLRTKRGLTTEFLLLRDQGTCCFGAQAQINHFVRVKYFSGFKHEGAVPWRVTGTIRVGEIYIQGYLTGIYQMEAEQVEEAGSVWEPR